MRTSEQFIFYGCGRNALVLLGEDKRFRDLSQETLISKGVCFADRNVSKQGKDFLGFPVLSLHEALNRYPDAKLYITLAEPLKYQVMYEMHRDFGFGKETIEGYVEVEERVSCENLDNYIAIRNDIICGDTTKRGLCFCCNTLGTPTDVPMVEHEGDYKETFQRFLNLRESIIYNLSHGIPTACDGCIKLRKGYYPKEPHKIRNALIGSLALCNFNCIYCLRHDQREKRCLSDELDVATVLKLVKQYNGREERVWVFLAYGEISVHPAEFKRRLYKALEGCDIMFVTNASVYDEWIHEQLKTNCACGLDTSIDSGTPETFKIIKGRDEFDAVCENLRRYREDLKGEMQLKYIFLPGINDNTEDIGGFIRLCRELEPVTVIINSDLYGKSYKDYNNPTTIAAVKYFDRLCKEYQINYINWSDLCLGRLLRENP